MKSKLLPISPEFDPLKLTRTDITKLAEQSLRELEDDVVPRDTSFQEEVQREERRRCDPNALSDDEQRCFKAIREYPEPIDFRCARLGWDRDREYAARKQLARRGFVQCAGSIANKQDIWIPTPKGETFARKQGWATASYKSGALHEAARQAVKIGMARSLKEVRLFDKGFADVLAGMQPDLIFQFQGGQLGVVQVCDRNQAPYEVERLLKLCGIEHVDIVVSAPVNSTTKAKLERELNRQAGKVWPGKLRIRDLGLVLPPSYDWSWVMETET